METVDNNISGQTTDGSGTAADVLAAIQETEDSSPPVDDRPLAGKHIFISHNWNPQDDSVAGTLHTELTELGAEVYLDTAQRLGAPIEFNIRESLKKADFVIPLISPRSNESDWVKWELEFAAAQGHAVLLPIGLEISIGDLDPRLGAKLSGLYFKSYAPSECDRIVADVVNAIVQGPLRVSTSPIGLESSLISDYQKRLTRASTVSFPELERALECLRDQKLLWVVADGDIKNHFARSLAVTEHDRRVKINQADGPSIYEVPRSFTWSRVDDQLIRNAIVVFPDLLPSVVFDEESPRNELKSLKRLVERNLVVVTLSQDAYAEIQYQMRNHDFNAGTSFELADSLYDQETRRLIFERLLSFLCESRTIENRHMHWVQALLKEPGEGDLRSVISNWSPADMERFLSRHLPHAKSARDIPKLAQQTADLEKEIHSWFLELDDSSRCFVLTVAMLSGSGKHELWKHYKSIVNRLHSFDPALSLRPLGIARYRAAPYVTVEGPIDFVDERIAEAVYDEVSQNFREYLLELCEIVQKISIPAERSATLPKEVLEERRRMAFNNRVVRAGLARIMGKAARYGLHEELIALLDAWGGDAVFGVRDAVTLCLEQAVTTRHGEQDALALMRDWGGDTSNREEGLFRTWAAASTLPLLAAANPRKQFHERTFDLLARLAVSNRPRVKLSISMSLKKALRRLVKPDSTDPRLLQLLATLAADVKPATKVNVAEAIIEMRIINEAAALSLIGEWLQGLDPDCRWVAMCSTWLWRKQSMQQRHAAFNSFLQIDAATAASVIVEIINPKYQRPIFWESFETFGRESDEPTRRALVAALALVPQSSLAPRLLPLLRNAKTEEVRSLVSEIRAEKWRLLLAAPTDFVSDLHHYVTEENSAGEVHAALLLLLRPEPEGCRNQLIEALVACFIDRRAVLNDILSRLAFIAPMDFEPFALEIRRAGLEALFTDPLGLTRVLSESLNDPSVAGETTVALETLIHPSQLGKRDEFKRALAIAQTLDIARLRDLLRQFRDTASTALLAFAFDFRLYTLEEDLEDPDVFLSRLIDSLRESNDRAEALTVLRQLSMPEPQGRRHQLIRVLATRRLERQAEVDWLLDTSARHTIGGVLSFASQVKLFSVLSRLLSPGIAARVFNFAS